MLSVFEEGRGEGYNLILLLAGVLEM